MEASENIGKEQLVERLKVALENEPIEQLSKVFRDVKVQFEELSDQERKNQRETFNKTAEDGDRFEFIKNPIDEDFGALAREFKEKKNAHKRELANKHEENYAAKRGIIEKLEALVNGELKNIGASFKSFYELRDSWQEIGEVNQARYKQLQHDYSHLSDLFYYNIGIHKELQSYDLKKNAEQKEALIAKLKSLLEVESIRQLEHYIKEYQTEWDKIGPTEQEKWEKLKEEYWNTVNAIYEKIKLHYQGIRETQKAAYEKKESLLTQMKEILEANTEEFRVKEWKKLTDKVIQLQNEWKTAGYSKKANETNLYDSFKTLANGFFEKKSEFYEKLKGAHGDVAEKKKELIEQAKTLAQSKQWKDTSEKLIRLQKEWKRVGMAHPKIDNKLWHEFRKNCDQFFTAKKEYYDTLDDRKSANTTEKKSILDRLKKGVSKEEFQSTIKDWYSVGVVAKDKMKTLQDQFNSELKKTADKLKMEDADALAFKLKMEAYKAKENAQELIDGEKRFVRNQIDKIKDELHQYENNLSFFGPSKGSQKLKEVVDKKIDASRVKLDEWQAKLKIITGKNSQ